LVSQKISGVEILDEDECPYRLSSLPKGIQYLTDFSYQGIQLEELLKKDIIRL
jgi:hypothetical protein